MSGLSSVVYFASFDISFGLLNKYGEPKKANPEALRAFSQEFCYRKKASITSHPSYFNKGAYDAWRAANGGKWVGFTWTAPNGL